MTGTTTPVIPDDATLLLIDLQRAVDDPSWGPRNHPGAEQNVARLLSHWRRRHLPLVHIRHDSPEPASTYRPGQPGHEFKPEAAPLPGEVVVPKRTNSAFVGTDLEPRLRASGARVLVVAGVSTSNCVEATVRMGANLGFTIYLVEDACFAFARKDWSGRPRTAAEVHDMSVANLAGEYCTVVTTDEVLAAPRAPSRVS
ncbi:MAG TPA: cysteine hydrolase family protein [Gemmatimonadales bacterium]|nr:cysteine hydrolase family protein [Gemmatimonadales bacterium]